MSNKILFSLLSLGEIYTSFCNSFLNELLELTPYDIKVTTDCPDTVTKNSRIIIDPVDVSNNKIRIGYDFNYNLKHLCFKEYDSKYETIFYFDCDQKLAKFNSNLAENIIAERYKMGFDFLATRTNAVLESSLERFKKGESELFTHKILNYGLDKTPPPLNWLNARMPSEHFFILKNCSKVKKFYETWKELNDRTESLEVCHGVWGDGFEIGVSAAVAGFNAMEVNSYEQFEVFGIVFNGNKR